MKTEELKPQISQMNADLEKTARRFRIVAAVWRQLREPDFNSGEFARIAGQSGLNSFWLSVEEVKT